MCLCENIFGITFKLRARGGGDSNVDRDELATCICSNRHLIDTTFSDMQITQL